MNMMLTTWKDACMKTSLPSYHNQPMTLYGQHKVCLFTFVSEEAPPLKSRFSTHLLTSCPV